MDETVTKKENTLPEKSICDQKKNYMTPEIITEELLAFGAICNGSANGGRKDSTGAPKFCNASRLFS